MKKSLVLGSLVLGLLFSMGPTEALAQKPVNAEVIRLTESHVLFSLTFKLGFLNRATYVPFVTNTQGTELANLQFSLENTSHADETVPVTGILLTNEAPVVNNYYALPYGDSADFTLVAIATIPVNEDTYRLTVTDLPYLLEATDKTLAQASFPQDQMGNFVVTWTD